MLISFMLSAFYAECQNYVPNGEWHHANVIMLNVIMLNVIMLNVIMLNAVAPRMSHAVKSSSIRKWANTGSEAVIDKFT